MWVEKVPAFPCAVVGACQIGQAEACAVVARRPACLGSRDVGGAVDVDVAVVEGDGAAEDVAVAEDIEDVVVVVAAGGAARMDTCSDLSCGCPSQNAVLAYKTGRARWNMRWQIATEDVGSTGPEKCGLACRRAARWQFPGRSECKVVNAGGGRYHHARASKQASNGRQAGRHDGRLAGWIAKSMSLSLLHTSSRARRVRGGGSGSGRVGQDSEKRRDR